MKTFNNIISRSHALLNASKLSLMAAIICILLTAGYLIFNSYTDARKVHRTTIEVISELQLKRNILASMLSASRERTLLLLQMSAESDAFELDELNQKFSEKASIFITAREKLLSLPLTEKELSLLEKQRQKIIINQPKQSLVAQLFLDEKPEEATKLLRQKAIPGQNEVLKLITLMIDEYNKRSIDFIENMDSDFESNTDTYILFSSLLLFIGSIAIIIILTRISRREEQLLSQALDELAEQKFALDQHSIVAITDIEGTITYANDRFCNLSGYSRDELIGQNHRLINSAEKDKDYWQKMYQTISSGKVWHDVIRNQAKNGSLYWVDSTIVPFMGEDNKPRSYISIRTDITERILAEEQIRADEERFRDTAELLPAALYETDSHLKITYANRCTLEMFNISDDDLKQGFYSIDLFAPEEKKRAQQDASKRIHGEDPGVLEYQAIKKDGSLFPVLLYASCITRNNEITGFRGVIVNISDRKQSELALRRSQKMDAIGQLTGGIAHDFNNILNIILGNLELLQKQLPEDDAIQKRILSIHKSARRAADLTKQLLSFSLHQAENVAVTNINQLIEEMKALMSLSVTPHVDIEWHLADDLWLTEITPGDFEDSLLNLVLNARDAICESSWLTISTENTTLDDQGRDQGRGKNPEISAGDYVLVTVSDCGEGMTAEQLEHVFEPFYTTKEQGKGTGLGLAMVFGFIQRSKGHITVDSEQGVGSTFQLYLPRAEKDIQIADTAAVQTMDVPAEANETILVVDDEEALLELAEESLLDLGYHVLTAGNAKQALAILSREPDIALMVSDVIMPGGLNGYELAERATGDYPTLKVLLASGYTAKISNSENHNRFSNNLLVKPYTQAELALRVHEAFKN